ncbi:hypothetical protein COT72_05425 [archaeon CG10_big_fil_rev_8_21_14_0_10_43_11]|nr:MAG: hypothetical protein COT72_05425 [archaeon CG10_big_fil_rev_8_21_14_0_10_43_11]
MAHNTLILSLFFASALFITGCTQYTGYSDLESAAEAENIAHANNTSQSTTIVGEYSANEVAVHNSVQDCWMIINQNVYDVTAYVSAHPGGPTILDGCGIDATELFETRPSGSGTPHSQGARNILARYFIGTLTQQ